MNGYRGGQGVTRRRDRRTIAGVRLVWQGIRSLSLLLRPTNEPLAFLAGQHDDLLPADKVEAAQARRRNATDKGEGLRQGNAHPNAGETARPYIRDETGYAIHAGRSLRQESF